MRTIILTLIASVLLLALVSPSLAQVNGRVDVIDGKPILTVWGTHAERGYAAGFLEGAEGKEMFDDYIVGYCCDGSFLTYYFLRLHFTNNYEADPRYVTEAEGIIQGMSDAGVSLYNSRLMRDIDTTDLLVANAIVDLSALADAGPFACSSMSSWGSSTIDDPLLHGHLVITRLLDWTKNPTLTDNPLLTVHFPAEPDEQPWISIGYAGLFGALSAISESGVSAFLNMGNNESSNGGPPYHPILLTVRNGIEKADYDGDGRHTPSDVAAAIEDRARNIDTIVHVTKDDGVGSRPVIVESNNAAGVAVRDASDNTQVPGENLVATNHFRKLYAPVYCYRYAGIVDSLTTSTALCCERSWDVMAGAAGTVESEGLLLWSLDTYSEPAYMQPPTELSVDDLFMSPLGADAFVTSPVLRQNTPNPFNPRTEISFRISSPSHCGLAVYDVSGRLVATLLDGFETPGAHSVEWDGRTDDGLKAGTGVYLYRLTTDDAMVERKMLLLK
jgi:hypothetical protein